MDPEQILRWREADRLFGLWLDLAPAQRDAWLAREPIEPSVRAALQALIDRHRTDTDATPGREHVLLPEDAGEPRVVRNGLAGRRIGDWELIEEIGRGGMSVVYRARRLGVDFEQLAAVKLLGLAALGSEGHARFDQERRLLARLRHPHIAPLIDGGFAGDGTPYLVMALVEGETLARYCRGRALGWRDCVRLMIQVCDAVAHAHRNLMVHRDLKPSNIMVTPEGVPILLDFGIAKLLDEDETSTRTGLRALTPGYAAPEQRDGGEITTATDVHALGVVLRELVENGRDIPRDLRNIVAMATRPEAARRYPDARALAEDLARLLEQRAVHATPDSTGYRLRSFLRRRRGLALAVGAIALALCSGLGLALWQAQRAAMEAREARRQAERAEAARDFLFSIVEAGDRERSETLDPPVSTLIARGVERLQVQALDDPELHAEMATLLAHLDTSLGQHARAAELLDSALASATLADDPTLLMNVRVRQGILANATGDASTAVRRFDEALALVDRVAPERRDALHVAALGGWSYAMGNRGRGDEARAHLEAVLAAPGRMRDPMQRASLLLTLSGITPDPTPKLALLQDVERIFADASPSPALRLDLHSELAATLSRLRRHEEALPHAREAAALADRIHPGNTNRRARIQNNLGSVLSQSGRLGEADTAFATAEAIYRALGDDDSPAFAALLHNRGVLLRDLGAAELALPLLDRAHAIALSGFGAADSRRLIALRNLASVRSEIDADPDAERQWQECAALGAAAQPPALRFDHLIVGARIALNLGRIAMARERIDAARALLEDPAMSPTAHQRLRHLALDAECLSREGEFERADALFAAVETLARDDSALLWGAKWRAWLAQAEHLQAWGRHEAARTAYAKTLAHMEALEGLPRSTLLARIRAASDPMEP
jgi:serine/threonine protein kinase